MKTNKDLNYYLTLPWSYTVETAIENDESFYIVRVNELPGVVTDAPTIEEAMELIKEAMRGLFELYLEDGEEIPEPDTLNNYKGKITYRTSNWRHYLLMKEAKKRDQSLSEIIDEFIDSALQKA